MKASYAQIYRGGTSDVATTDNSQYAVFLSKFGTPNVNFYDPASIQSWRDSMYYGEDRKQNCDAFPFDDDGKSSFIIFVTGHLDVDQTYLNNMEKNGVTITGKVVDMKESSDNISLSAEKYCSIGYCALAEYRYRGVKDLLFGVKSITEWFASTGESNNTDWFDLTNASNNYGISCTASANDLSKQRRAVLDKVCEYAVLSPVLGCRGIFEEKGETFEVEDFCRAFGRMGFSSGVENYNDADAQNDIRNFPVAAYADAGETRADKCANGMFAIGIHASQAYINSRQCKMVLSVFLVDNPTPTNTGISNSTYVSMCDDTLDKKSDIVAGELSAMQMTQAEVEFEIPVSVGVGLSTKKTERTILHWRELM
jgi:hypothetical protein